MTAAPRNPGAWPRLMRAATAAAYVDEASVEAFRRKVGTLYPLPVCGRGMRQKWDREELDRAIAAMRGAPIPVLDAASVL
jgi:hypothetical protein